VKKLRIYGQAPFNVAVLHGGPGAPGTMAPVARELASGYGVLEPMQTAASLEGQTEELRAVLSGNADLPVTLIGWSWGAMLGFVFTARHPGLVKKLILVGSGVYQERYAARIQETRLQRLSAVEKREALSLLAALDDPATPGKNMTLARLGALFTRADSYDPLTPDDEALEVQYRLHRSVWRDARELRKSGQLLALGRRIPCPVVAIHGDHDPHPPEGVQKPLSAVVKNFRFILLPNCGHLPWLERAARDKFFAVLRAELR